MGWTKRAPLIDGSRPQAARRREHLIHLLRQEGAFGPVPERTQNTAAEMMELITGPAAHTGSHFRDREDLRRAWELGRAELLARAQPGRRPLGFYEFDWPHGPRPPYDLERSTLWRSGLLGEDEKRRLEVEWFKEFNRAQAADFALARPYPEEMLEGRAARREHYRWADIPDTLIQQWSKERRGRRRGKRGEAARDPAAGEPACGGSP
jgi:hypothetical protein